MQGNINVTEFLLWAVFWNFPKTFACVGSKIDLEQIIGNAVPVGLATFVGRHLVNFINIKQKNELDHRFRLWTD